MSKQKKKCKKCKKTSRFESPCSYMQKLAINMLMENLQKNLQKGVKNDH